MTPLRVAFRTLGCKLNQLETESLVDAFAKAGASVHGFDESADIYVINTCTVTGKAEQKARRTIRQAAGLNPDAVVLVTGCYAQMDPEGLGFLVPRALVVSGDEKSSILSLADWLGEHWQGHGDLYDAVREWNRDLHRAGENPREGRFAFHPGSFAVHSRPSLKIQDGCNNRCTYCRVCIARGPSVSLSAEEALLRVGELEAAGKAEVVLTGINLSQYRSGNLGFAALLRYLTAHTHTIRFRISSFEPERIDETFLEAFAHPRVQPHVHLAMQSGSDTVLRRMARAYDAAKIEKAVASLRAVKDDPFIAADIIAGFPGETDQEFAETQTLCAGLDLAWIHAFPFSARPGTPAFDMRPKVPERVAGERVLVLGDLARRGKARYLARWTGKSVPLILEKDCNHDTGDEVSFTSGSFDRRCGTTSNYLKVVLPPVAGSPAAGTEVAVVILGPSSEPGADAFGTPR